MSASPTMSLKNWGLLLLLSVLWGGSFFFTEIALESTPPLLLALARVSIAALALMIVLRTRGERLPTDARLWGAFAIMGAINNAIPFSLIMWGQTGITGGLAAILNASTPIWSVILAHFLVRGEGLTWLRGIGVALGFTGVAVMMGPEALRGLGGAALAQGAVVLATLSYACSGIFGRRFSAISPTLAATGQLTAASVLLFPFAVASAGHAAPDLPAIGAILGLALASTALAYILYFRILREAGPTNVLLVTLLVPVSAILLGALFLGERLASGELIGMACIAAGLLAIDGRLPARLFGRADRNGRTGPPA